MFLNHGVKILNRRLCLKTRQKPKNKKDNMSIVMVSYFIVSHPRWPISPSLLVSNLGTANLLHAWFSYQMSIPKVLILTPNGYSLKQ